MAEPAPTRVLLIDLDNCPKQLRHLPEALSGFARVVACHGGADPKVSLTLVPLLARALQEGRLEIVRMKLGGPNAADFGLAFWAGRLVEQVERDAEFLIFSGDRDLDHVVQLLKSAGRQVQRLDGNHFVPNVVPIGGAAVVAATGGDLETRLRQYVKMQLISGNGRPKRRDTLLSSIRAFCASHPGAEPEAILQALVRQGLVTISAQGHTSYALEGERPAG